MLHDMTAVSIIMCNQSHDNKLLLIDKLNAYYCGHVAGNMWSIVVSSPEAIAAVFRAEGKFPERGVEANMMWIYDQIKKPYPMFFAYVCIS